MSVDKLLEEIRTAKDSKEWGPKAWKALETVCLAIPCDDCRDHCLRMIRFEHDVVNAKLGKAFYDPKNVIRYLGILHEVLNPDRVQELVVE